MNSRNETENHKLKDSKIACACPMHLLISKGMHYNITWSWNMYRNKTHNHAIKQRQNFILFWYVLSLCREYWWIYHVPRPYPFPEKSKRKALIPSLPRAAAILTKMLSSCTSKKHCMNFTIISHQIIAATTSARETKRTNRRSAN